MGDRIRTPDQRLRVFVSSTLGELAEERRAAREAIEQLRLAPVMFELGARPHPPRALYRAYLEQSDVFVGIYWQRYGWVAPDMDISGLEDEYRLSGGVPRLMYLKRPAPDMEPELRRLLKELESDGSVSYRPFESPEELGRLLLDDLAVMLAERFDAAGAHPTAALPPTAPQPTTRLVGREADVATVAGMLTASDHRLVTLTGVGGIGKTRLALAVMERTLDEWAGGAYFVDLTAATHVDAVVDVIATSCGIVAEGRQTEMDALTSRLGGQRSLLVLDNFEHVAGAAPAVAELLTRCPALSVLVTSRTVLHLRGEQEWPVAPLGVPDEDTAHAAQHAAAVQLFVERVQEARPSFELTADNQADVVALVRRLDGLPLALELVAPRLRLLTPDQVLGRLGQRLDLVGSLADLPERQRTLGATLDWSHELLDEAARTLLRRLAALSGPFTFDTVEEVCGFDIDVVEALSTLVDHSLVTTAERADGKPAFRMLETVRAYALERLADAGDAAAVFERLRDYLERVFADAAPRLHTAEQGITLRRLDAEIGNFVSLFEWVVDGGRSFGRLLSAMGETWVFWQVRGHFRRIPEMLPRLQQSQAGRLLAPQDWSGIHLAHAGNLFTTGRYAEVVEWVPTVVEGVREALGTTEAAMLCLMTAASRPYSPDTPAREEFAAAEQLLRDSHERIGLGYCLAHRGSLLLVDGDVEGARRDQQEALAIGDDAGDVNLKAEARMQLAHVAVAAGDLAQARGLLAEAGAMYRRIDHRAGIAYCLGVAAGIAAADGDAERTARLLGAAAAVRETVGAVAWPLVEELERRFADQARHILGQGYERSFAQGRDVSIDEELDIAKPVGGASH